jgi:hypothetical protein
MSVIKSCKTAFTLFNSPIISEFGFALKCSSKFNLNAFRTEQSVRQSVLLVREKYEATKVLEVGDKVKKLGRTHKWLLSLASRNKILQNSVYPV